MLQPYSYGPHDSPLTLHHSPDHGCTGASTQAPVDLPMCALAGVSLLQEVRRSAQLLLMTVEHLLQSLYQIAKPVACLTVSTAVNFASPGHSLPQLCSLATPSSIGEWWRHRQAHERHEGSQPPVAPDWFVQQTVDSGDVQPCSLSQFLKVARHMVELCQEVSNCWSHTVFCMCCQLCLMLW